MFTNLHNNESPKMAGARMRLVEELKRKGIANQTVLQAMAHVPRQFFFPPDFEQYVYRDEAFPIGFNQTISQPYTVAYQTALLNIFPNAKVLEIGTGSGYQAAILHYCNAKVYSVEVIKELCERAKLVLKKLDIQVQIMLGDGTLGWPDAAPFDRILVTAGAPKPPVSLLNQLSENGSMVIPIGPSPDQLVMKRMTKTKNGFKEESFGEFKFVPLKGKEGW